jgi:2'-5' RNA ligase
MEIRSFLAFELPPEIKKTVRQVSEAFRKTRGDVRWVRAGNIHLTVIFLGNVREEDIEGIGSAAGEVCRAFAPFEVALQGVGLFPDQRRPRVIWLGLGGDLERLSAFRDDLQEALGPFGVKREKRAFRPHLTLGRFKAKKKMPPPLVEGLREYRDLESPVWSLAELVLFKSTLKPGGAEYTKLASWKLTGEGISDP